MLGSMRWNFAMGAAGLLLTFLFSSGNNGFTVSCLRALYAFIAFFLLAFLFRFALFLITGTGPAIRSSADEGEEGLGGTIDAVTPAEGEDLNELLKAQLEGDLHQPNSADFRPLTPKKLVSAQDKNPEELAQVIRHLAEQNGD